MATYQELESLSQKTGISNTGSQGVSLQSQLAYPPKSTQPFVNSADLILSLLVILVVLATVILVRLKQVSRELNLKYQLKRPRQFR